MDAKTLGTLTEHNRLLVGIVERLEGVEGRLNRTGGTMNRFEDRLEALEDSASQFAVAQAKMEKTYVKLCQHCGSIDHIHIPGCPHKPKPQKEPDLLPCPFCGSKSAQMMELRGEERIWCSGCDSETNPFWWNQREKP